MTPHAILTISQGGAKMAQNVCPEHTWTLIYRTQSIILSDVKMQGMA